MKEYIIAYYDNKFHKFANIKYGGVSKSQVVQKFINNTPNDFTIINIIEL